MPRQAMTIRTRPTAYSVTPVIVADMDVFDSADGMTLAANSVIGLTLHNDTGGPLTYTATSVADSHGATKDYAAQAIADGEYHLLQEFPQAAWATGGLINIDATGAIKYLAVQRAIGQ